MVTKELIFFIRQSKTAGKTNDQIKAALLQSGGWANSDIEEGFRQVALGDGTPSPAPNIPASPVAAAPQTRPTPLVNFPPNMQGQIQAQMINPINQRPMSVARPGPIKKKGHGVLIFFIILLLLLG